jgi:nickel-dependent lactate racemase
MYKLQITGNTVTYSDQLENRSITIPREQCLGLFEAGNPPAITDESTYLRALQHPVAGSDSGKTLREIASAKKAKTAAIIVSDVTRNVPTAKVASLLVDELIAGGVPPEGITFFVALGVHRNASEPEMKSFVGSDLYGKVRIENHDAFDPDGLIDLGTTPRGTPVLVNKKAYLCDVKVVVGKVELHEMAGFSGGRKSILPGVASEKTILVNHRPEMIFAPGVGAGKLEGNPIHEDMLDTARMFKVDFCVSFVVDASEKPAAVYAGGLLASHRAAVEYLRQFCTISFPHQADIFVITPGSPLNCDMYQGVKALIAMHQVLDSRSVVLFYGSFPEGMNSTDFLEPFARHPESFDKARDYAWKNYAIQMDHSLPILDIMQSGVRVVVCAEKVKDKDIEILRMTPCAGLDAAIRKAFDLCGKATPKVAFFPQPQRAVITR